MGVCGTKDSKSVLDPVCPTDPDHMSIEKQFGPLIDPKHPNNLNHKYSHLYKVDLNMVIGEGIKRTCGYVSRVPIEEIRKKRLEFWGKRY